MVRTKRVPWRLTLERRCYTSSCGHYKTMVGLSYREWDQEIPREFKSLEVLCLLWIQKQSHKERKEKSLSRWCSSGNDFPCLEKGNGMKRERERARQEIRGKNGRKGLLLSWRQNSRKTGNKSNCDILYCRTQENISELLAGSDSTMKEWDSIGIQKEESGDEVRIV